MKLNSKLCLVCQPRAALFLNLSAAAAPETTPRPAPEPNFQIASEWWTDLWAFWTPVGWKDHLHRFNVLWSGTILAKPDMNRRSGGQGLQLSLTPDYEEWARQFKADTLRHDDHKVRQGWTEDEAPVLWSEWSTNGWRIRSEVFAHIPGGGDVQTGNEPLFLWLRLRVFAAGTARPAETGQDFDRAKGVRVLEADSKVRLAVAPGGDSASVVFSAAESDQPWYRLRVKLPAKKGAQVDVLLPMVSAERAVFDAEMALGYDAALSETRRYWQEITVCPTRIEVPEAEINDCIRQSVRFSNLLTEKDPATGKYCKVNGSWTYADLWTTPGSMDLVMLMDTLGHHRECLRRATGDLPGPAVGDR